MRKFGIDLGTTNTCIYQANFSIADTPDEFNLNVVPIHYENPGDLINPPITANMPSAIYGRRDPDAEDEKYVFYLGNIAIYQAKQDNVPDIINTKRLLCREDPETEIKYGLTAQDIAQKLLEGCRYSIQQAVTERQMNNAAFCITQPAAFGLFASRSIQDAAIKAGFVNAEPQREPIAALLSFLYDKLKNADTVKALFDRQAAHNNKLLTMVVDIGGGTTDVTIQEIRITGTEEPNQGSLCCTGYNIKLLNQEAESDASSGPVATANIEPAFGGFDFDKKIAEYIISEWNRQYFEKKGHNFDWSSLIGNVRISDLYQKVQGYKNSLSLHPNDPMELDVSIVLDDVSLNCKINAELVYSITKELCESINGSQKTERTVYGIIADTIRRSGYSVDEIDYLFVTGGMSSYKPIRDMMIRNFTALAYSDSLVFSTRPLEDIARGAAVCNCFFSVDMPQTVLYADLMIDDPCGPPKILVARNKALPAKGEEKNFMQLRNPIFLYVDVLWGLGTKDCELKRLRRLRKALPNGKVTKMGTPIDVKWTIDAHQAMDVELIVHDIEGEYTVNLLKLIRNIDLTNGGNTNG